MLYVLIIWAANDIEQEITQSVAPLQVGGRRLIGMRVGDAIIPAALGPAWTVLLHARAPLLQIHAAHAPEQALECWGARYLPACI
jgi:hypothetical protein